MRFLARQNNRGKSIVIFLFTIYSFHINAQHTCDTKFDGINSNQKNKRELSTTSTCSSLRYIRINIHFMLKSDGTGNFREFDDGLGNTSKTGYWYAQDLISRANDNMANNAKMLYPIGNTIDNPVTNIRYVLSGVYFHRDDNFYSYTAANRQTQALNSTYGVDINTEMNVFMQNSDILNSGGVEIADLGGIASSITPPVGQYWAKLVDIWRQYKKGNESWIFTGTFNHEIGHLLGLYHPFQGDNCIDTPTIPGYSCAHNNLMDYNCANNAITPCQLGIMQNNLDGLVEPYRICCAEQPATAMFGMRSHVCNSENIILNGSWRTSKKENNYSLEIYQTDAVGSNAIVGNYWTQSFSGQYGDINLSSLYTFSASNTYRVKLTVNSTGSCANTDSEIKWVTLQSESLYLQNQTVNSSSVLFSNCHYFIGQNVDNNQAPGNVIITNSGNISVKSGASISIENGTLIENGAVALFEVNNASIDYNNTQYRTNNSNNTPEQNASISFEEKNNIKYFPNPNNGIFNVILTYPETQKVDISINNSLGEEVFYKDLGYIKEHSIEITLANKPEGFYFIKVKTDQGIETKKILIID